MSAVFEAEQAELQTRLVELDAYLQRQKAHADDISAFQQIIRKYSEITELDATTLHGFVEKIRVFQALKDDAGHRVQHVKICFNFIGEIYIPEEYLADEEDTEENYTFKDEETA